jgi:hypothetical protein
MAINLKSIKKKRLLYWREKAENEVYWMFIASWEGEIVSFGCGSWELEVWK